MKNKVELLAPAGNIESFKAACQNGADAIYMGIDKFNARVMAQNFTLDEYIECIEYAHMRNTKVYLTLNTLIYNDEIKEALELVLMLYAKGLDAVIVQDIGFAMLLHEYVPELPLHASTQMSVYTLSQVKFLEKIGFKRVVLARELTIEEIEYICKNTDVEIEVFVHGALCVSFSGQCLLSGVIGNRSANRGNCAQPCRMKYSLYNKSDKKVINSTYIMSKKDIFGLDYIQKLISIGVHSLKLEGRNKNAIYVAGVTNTYRKYIDKILEKNEKIYINEEDKKELLQLFNRNGISSGYLNGVKYKDSITLKSPKNTGIYLGKVEDQKGIYVKIKLEEDINLHDGFEIFSEDTVYSSIVTCIKEDKGKIINKDVKAGSYIWLGDVDKKIKYGSEVYKTSSDSLNKKYKLTYDNNVQNKKNIVNLNLDIKKDKKIHISIYANDKNKNIEFDYKPEISLKKKITKEAVIDAFLKTKDTPFTLNIQNINIDNGLFIPISKLNELRRYIIEEIKNMYVICIDVDEKMQQLDSFLESIKENNKIKNVTNDKLNSIYVYKYDKNEDYIKNYKEAYNKKLDCIYIDIFDYIKNREDIINKYLANIKVVISIPNVVLEKGDKIIEKNLDIILNDKVYGFLLGSLAYFEKIKSFKDKYNIKIIADYTLNAINTHSVIWYKKIGFDEITLGYDVLKDDIEEIKKYTNIQVVKDYITVMTSRYCILGSMVDGRDENTCKKPCIHDNYYLKDTYDKNYEIVTNNIDCIMKIVTKTYKFDELEGRNSII